VRKRGLHVEAVQPASASPRPPGWSIQLSSLLQADRVDLSSPTTRDIVCSEAQRCCPKAAGRRAFGGTRRCGTFYPLHCRLSPIDPFTLSRATWDG